jgi:ferredoxin
MCSDCHREIDQGNLMNKEEKQDAWQRAHEKTLLEMFLQGILKVK